MITACAVGYSEEDLKIFNRGFEERATLKVIDPEGLSESEESPDLIIERWDKYFAASEEIAEGPKRNECAFVGQSIPLLIVLDWATGREQRARRYSSMWKGRVSPCRSPVRAMEHRNRRRHRRTVQIPYRRSLRRMQPSGVADKIMHGGPGIGIKEAVIENDGKPRRGKSPEESVQAMSN